MIFYAPLKKIRAVTFDMDDTLYDNGPIIDRAESWFKNAVLCHPALNASGISLSEVRAELEARDPLLASDVTRGRETALRCAFMRSGMDAELASQEAAFLQKRFIAVRSDFCVPEKTVSVLRKLRQRVKVAALTNGNADPALIGLDGEIDFCLRASGFMMSKPAPDLFWEAASRFGLKPGEVMHVGDDAVTDIIGAKNAGFMSCAVPSRCGRQAWKVLPDVEISDLSELLDIVGGF